MALQTRPFDVVDYLTDEETIAFYLAESLEGNDPHEIARAEKHVARARIRLASSDAPADSPAE
jgi:DNA-binding phage protein